MIVNGTVTYASKLHPLQSWGPSNEALSILLTAFISTLLSYQAASVILALSFGIKSRGTGNIADIHIHHLVHRASPLAVVRSLFPKTFSKIRPDMGSVCSDEVLHKQKNIHSIMVVKLLVFLLVAPVVNVIAIILTTEYEEELTFSEAKFGGLRLGVNSNLEPVKKELLGPEASQVFIGKDLSDTLLVSFSVWRSEVTTWLLPETEGHPQQESTVFEISQDNFTIGMTFNAPGIRTSTIVVAEVMFLEGPNAEEKYLLPAGGNHLVLSGLLEYGSKVLWELCSLSEGELSPIVEKSERQEISVERQHNCSLNRLGHDGVQKLFEMTLGKVTVIDGLNDDPDLVLIDKTLLGIIAKEAWNAGVRYPDLSKAVKNGGEFLFLRRKRSCLSFPLLGILSLAALVIRIVVDVLANNDLGKATGLIVREELDIPWCDTMMASRDRKVVCNGTR